MGYLRLADAAQVFGVPRRTLTRWLSQWHTLGVEGVVRVRARARNGQCWLVSPDLAERWRDCSLPSPHRAEYERLVGR